MKKRIFCLILLIALLLPTGALAAKASIRMPVQVGMLYVNQTVTVKPSVSNVRRSSLKWESSNSAVVTAKSGGKLTGVREGLALVRASGSGARAVCGVVVLPKSISLTVGESYCLPSHSMLEYAAANPRIADISDSGVIRAVSAGTAKVGVRCGKVGLTVSVAVSPAPTAAQSKAAQLDCANDADQIVLVEYQGGSSANVSFHEKIDGVWTELYATSGYVGANGIGKTREGDKKTPTGTYNLTTPFGIKADPGSALPYTQVTKYHYWCGTSSSKYYNQLVDSRVTGRAATSSDEKLINYTGYYNYCLFIDYNAEGVAHKGSCIFLHCTGGKSYTAGCIAIPEAAMKQAVKWVRDGAKIVIQ